MASSKIKKKTSKDEKASFVPRQGAVPCLVLMIIALVVLALFFFGALHNLG
jgi:hypothetical protein